MKKIVSVLLALVTLFCVFALPSCDLSSDGAGVSAPDGFGVSSKTQKEREFYELVDETQGLLDIVADDIYSYWYDCIYNDKYLDNISYAVAAAQSDNEKNLNKIEENTVRIKALYKEIKDGKLGSEAKAVMQAYNDYYTLVVEVSGSFSSYSSSKETCKKELASALDDLEFELD